ncbi:hypothetical protein B0H16DRAFT_1474874 [Mycena metata]|uniref:Uncharacterized protein n=1 Tax=Mycena metata TaxID=1033252 RepID=A0AAD7MJE8_9AGAR|nr:hypothetical protein B0H16DRAFT_1474874 [Mycena metata]
MGDIVGIMAGSIFAPNIPPIFRQYGPYWQDIGRRVFASNSGIAKQHGNSLRALELWEAARPLFKRSSQTKQIQDIDERLSRISEEVKEQHMLNVARLAELNAPAWKAEDVEEDLSEDELE